MERLPESGEQVGIDADTSTGALSTAEFLLDSRAVMAAVELSILTL